MPASAPKRDSYSYSSMARALHEEEDENEFSRAQALVAASELSASDDGDASASAEALGAAALGEDPAVSAGATGCSAAQAERASSASQAPAGAQPAGASPSPAGSSEQGSAAAQPTGSALLDQGDATALGSAFHAAAQWLIETGAEEVPPARRAALARYWHLTGSQVERLDAALDRWEVSSVRAELNGWPLVRAEVPFFSLGLDDAKVRERFGTYAEGAIDALATDPADPSRALVIDYKTGGSAAETPEGLQRKHALQARVYADVLHKAGFCTVELKFVRVEREDEQAPGEPQVVSYRLEADGGTESATMPAM